MRFVVVAATALVMTVGAGAISAEGPRPLTFQSSSGQDLRTSVALIDSMLRAGDLRVSQIDRDYMLPARHTERLQQFYRGVPIFGADLARDVSTHGTEAVYGTLYGDLSLETNPAISLEQASIALRRSDGSDATLLKPVELVLLPLDSNRIELAYSSVVAGSGTVARIFVSARDGSELMRLDQIHTQSSVGRGHGVLGDEKKISVLQDGGAFVTDDRLRPPVLVTFDMRGNFGRAQAVVAGAGLLNSDRATDSDNDWTDPAVVDAHVHAGWTYDYIYKRFGRRGLDARDRPIVILTNGVTQQESLYLSASQFWLWVANAFWCDDCGPGGIGVMFFGNGIPSNYYMLSTGQNYTYMAGALDVAAHELAHGITSSSSNLIYRNESGALNEAFSDIIGTSVEFYYQTAGNALRQADYLIGEDVARAKVAWAKNGLRSMAEPGMFSHPDHYTGRYSGTSDNGGVHVNSGIVNHAFYLAVEGGTNRTSGLSVQGVGAASREQIEKVFFRAFVQLLPSTASFATARAATIQAAKDLYGAGSPAERAVTQAWTAVGVM